MTQVTHIGSIVVIGLDEGQIDQVIYDEVDTDEQNQQSGEDIFVHGRHVISNPHAVEYGNHEVSTLQFARL